MKYLLIAVGLVILTGCRNSKESNVLNQQLALIEANATFSLDSLQRDDWNVCYLIRPYANADSLLQALKTRNSESALVRNNAQFNDGVTTLLFVKDNRIIDVQTISRKVMDFAALPDSINQFYPASKLMINSQREVEE